MIIIPYEQKNALTGADKSPKYSLQKMGDCGSLFWDLFCEETGEKRV